jgi:parallel beta-helix repeat protein
MTVTTDLKLTRDLSPCPGDGLVIEGHNLTIDLNGHSIVGLGAGTGIRFTSIAYGVTLRGPSQVATFGTGLVMRQTNHNLVYGINFYGNGVAIDVSQANTLRIFGNTLDGGSNGSVGIHLGETVSVFVYQNRIVCNGVVGVEISLGAPVIDQNDISNNQKGVTSTREASPILRGNTLRGNYTTGIELLFAAGTVEDNTLTGNGGDGITITGFGANLLVQDNVLRNNNGNGIKIASSTATGTKITGNVLGGNTVDFFWDGTSPACWFQNVYSTSTPAVLAACAL